MKYPYVAQHDQRDCGAACLSMVSEYYGLKLPLVKFRQLIKVDTNGANMLGIIEGASQIGFNASALQGTPDELLSALADKDFSTPFIARVVLEKQLEHFIVVYKINRNQVIVGDPGRGICKISIDAFLSIWSGHIVTLSVTERFQKGNNRNSYLTKVLRLVLSQKKLLVKMVAISLLTIAISLFSSFLFGYVISYALIDDESSAVGSVEESTVESTPAAIHESEEHEHESEDIDFSYKLLNVFLSEETIAKLGQTLDSIFSNHYVTLLSIILLYLIQIVILSLRSFWIASLSKNVDIPLLTGYFNHMLDLPLSALSSLKSGELLSRFSDASQIRSAIITTLITLILDAFYVIFGGIALILINAQLFFISTSMLFFYVLVLVFFINPIKKSNQKVMDANAKVVSYTKEAIDGIETIKSRCGEPAVKEKTKQLLESYEKHAFKSSLLSNFQDILIGSIAGVGIVFIMYIGSILISNHALSVGVLFTFYNIFSSFIDPVKSLVELQPTIQTAFVAADRLNDIEGIDTDVDSKPKSKTELHGDIQFKEVSFRYGNRDLVLKDINLLIPEGSRIAIVGSSGSGKTTLIKLLQKFYSPESGIITIGGQDIATISTQQVRKLIGYVSQNVFFFADTIRNNLLFGCPSIETANLELDQVCSNVAATEFIDSLPFGYDTMLDENADNLSAGQKQRLAIARALLGKPKILVLDEATSNLDSITEQYIQRTIHNVSKEITCIIIAHRLSTVKDCDYICVMNDGQIVEFGSHQQLLDLNGYYAKLCSNSELSS